MTPNKKEKKRRWGLILAAVLLMALIPLAIVGIPILTGGGHQTITPTNTTMTTGVQTTGPVTTHITTTVVTTTTECAPDLRSNMECTCMSFEEASDYYFNNPDMEWMMLMPDEVSCYDDYGLTQCGPPGTYPPVLINPAPVEDSIPELYYDNCWLVIEPCDQGCGVCLNLSDAVGFLGTGDPDEMVTHLCKWTLCGIDEWGSPKLCWDRDAIHPTWTVPQNYYQPAMSGDSNIADSGFGTESPGYGLIVALTGLVAVALLAARRRG